MNYHITKVGNVYVTDERGVPRDCQPVAVVPFEDREQIERLTVLFLGRWYTWQLEYDAMQAALREFANPTPPKPKEPTGLGAVVEVASGELYIRPKTTSTNRHWKRARGEECSKRHTWDELQVVRILNDGYEVQP